MQVVILDPLRFICCVIFSLLVSTTPLEAQDNRITVRDAIEIALQNNPELNRASEQITIERTYTGPSFGLQSPELYYYKEGINDDLFSEQTWGVSQSFTFPLKSYYQLKKVRADIDVAEMRVNALKNSIRAAVKLAYTELAYTLKSVELTEREVELAEELRQTAEARLEAGESTELDLIQAEIQLTQSQNALMEARRVQNDARYALFRTIGLNPDEQRYGITYPDTLAFVDVNISQEQVISQINVHPEIKLSELRIESAQRNLKVARSKLLPDLRFDYYRQDFGNGYDFNGFQLGVTIPLWFGVNEKEEIQRARAVKNQADWSLVESDLKLKEGAEKAWHGYEASRQKIVAHINVIESRSSMLLELTREGYRMGELDLLRLLEAQRTYLQGQHVYYQTLKDYYMQLIELERYLTNEIVFTD